MIDRKQFTLPREILLLREQKRKSAEVVVVESNEPMEKLEDSQFSEGLNIKQSEIRYGGSNFEFASLVLNYDKGVIGVKSGYTILNEPPCT